MTAAEEELFWEAIRRDYPDVEGSFSAENDGIVDLGWAHSLPGVEPRSTSTSTSTGTGTGTGTSDLPSDPFVGLLTGRIAPESLRELEPSGLLLDALDGVGSAELDDTDLFDDLSLLEIVAAWQRVVSMATAGAARAAAALSRRECVQVPGGPVPVGRGHRCYSTLRATGTEIAMRTGCTVRSGELLARDGRLFDAALAATGSALARGQIDPRTARAIADRLVDLPLELALEVQAQVLPGAGVRSPAQVDRDLTRALVEVDPAEAAARHRRARSDRRVCHPKVLADGMAGIWAVLPAETAALVDSALSDAATSARAAGDQRTIDQLRADALVDLVAGTATSGTGAGTGTGSAARVHVDVTVALSTLLGLDDAPGDLAGYGAITAEQAAALAAGGALRRIVTDLLSGAVLDVGRTRYRPPAALRAHVVARDRTCARPGCVVPAERAEIDHTVPFGTAHLHDPGGTPGASTGPSQGDTCAGNLAPLCAPDHLAKTLGVLHLEQPSPGVLDWTTATGLRLRVVPGRYGETSLLPRRLPTTSQTSGRAAPPPF